MTSRPHHILKILNRKLAINFAWPNMIIIMIVHRFKRERMHSGEYIVITIYLSTRVNNREGECLNAK